LGAFLKGGYIMQLSEIKAYVKSLSENDQSIADADIIRWIDSGIRKLNQLLKCNIPLTTGQPDTYVPAFDSNYHDVLLYFAEAKYRESDSDYQSAQYFTNMFNEMVMDMQRDMKLNPSIRTDPQVQQITVTSADTLVYNLTMNYGSYFDVFDVYQNDVWVDPKYYKISMQNKQITFTGITLAVNDKITIVFENNSDLNNPPYQWWGQTGW
jgi:hypothetical protein